MKRLLLACLVSAAAVLPATAASVSRSYSYFSITGDTLEEIERELRTRGPEVRSSGQRHPGATRMEFSVNVTYGERDGRCSIIGADVTVRAEMILPRWRRRGTADEDTRLIWDTLAADIRRHEESHVVIARTHAREMEMALLGIRHEASCQEAGVKAKATTDRLLEKHDREQARFDTIETINFERRIRRLLDYRLQAIETGRSPG